VNDHDPCLPPDRDRRELAFRGPSGSSRGSRWRWSPALAFSSSVPFSRSTCEPHGPRGTGGTGPTARTRGRASTPVDVGPGTDAVGSGALLAPVSTAIPWGSLRRRIGKHTGWDQPLQLGEPESSDEPIGARCETGHETGRRPDPRPDQRPPTRATRLRRPGCAAARTGASCPDGPVPNGPRRSRRPRWCAPRPPARR